MINPVVRLAADLVARITGPLTFRLILQPAIAIIAATRAGLNDARLGKPAYFWSLFTDSGHRLERLREGWTDVAKVFTAAFVVDLIYQWIATRWLYPGEALIVALLLAGLPYALMRGAVNRIARWWMDRGERS